MELLVGIAVGTIFVVGAATIIAPSLQVNKQAGTVQQEAQFGQQLLGNVQAWSASDWGAVLSLATGTANRYYLNTASSPFIAIGTSTAGESLSSCSGAMQGSAGYSWSREVTMNAAEVSSTLVDFPTLISGTYPYLATTAHGGEVQNANGDDIVFTSDAAGSNVLPFEQESYSSSTGAINYWVQVPSLSGGASTSIYMWYGNPNITTSQANAGRVWSNGYAAVYHYPNGVTLSANDSTANGYNATVNGATATAGEIDGGASFGGSASISAPSSLAVSAPFTIDEWVYPESSGSTQGLYGSRTPSDTSFDAKLTGSGVHGDIGTGSSWLTTSADAAFTETLNIWYQITYVVGTSSYAIYEDGNQIGSGSLGGTALLANSTHILNFGWTGASGEYLTGLLDESRVSTVARSSGWILTEYNNQSNPAAFYTIGNATQGGSASSSSSQFSCTSYYRYFYLTDIYRDANGNTTTTATGNYYDPSTKLATVVVGMASSTQSPLTYSAFIFRSGNNVLDQGTWIGGSVSTSSPVSFVSSTYGSVNSITVNASGSLQLSQGPAPGGACVTQQASSILSYWPLDEGSGTVAYDSSGNGLNGACNGTQSSPSGTYYTVGKVGAYAGYFNGSNDYLQSPNLIAINSSTAPFSIALWFNPAVPGVILSETGQTAVNTGWHDSWIEALSGGNIDMRVWNCSALVAGVGTFNSWNYAVLTYDGTTLRSYLNGVAGASETCSRSNPAGSGYGEYFNFGAVDSTNLGSGAWFEGSIDDVRVYPRTISASEVNTLYSGGTVN